MSEQRRAPARVVIAGTVLLDCRMPRARPVPANPAPVRIGLRIDVQGRPTLGPGKVRLLELIGQQGSISAAGRAMGMSYRRAWALVESMNANFGSPVVEARPGGVGGGGAALLPLGLEIVALFRALEARTADGPELNALCGLLASRAAQ